MSVHTIASPRDLGATALTAGSATATADERRLQRVTVGVTAYLTALSLVALPATIWAFSIADRLTTAEPLVRVQWLGPDFHADGLTSCLLLGAVAGVVGSLVHAGHLFSRRVGRQTFETSYLVWYLMRPVLSALLAVVAVALARGGLVTLGSAGAGSSTPTLAFGIGALAGLFLDTVLQKLRAVLGATAVDEKASQQLPPEGGVVPALQEHPVG